MTDKVDSGLREKAFEVGYLFETKGNRRLLVILLDDAEAAIEEAERRGAERERERVVGVVINAVPRFKAAQKLVALIRNRTEGGTK